jgi:lipid A disaccharide synthetase
MTEILLVSGEASGDIHGANLIKQLKRTAHDLKFTAVGSNKMRSEGAHILFDIKNLSVMGILEVVKKFPQYFGFFAGSNITSAHTNPALWFSLTLLISICGLQKKSEAKVSR